MQCNYCLQKIIPCLLLSGFSTNIQPIKLSQWQVCFYLSCPPKPRAKPHKQSPRVKIGLVELRTGTNLLSFSVKWCLLGRMASGLGTTLPSLASAIPQTVEDCHLKCTYCNLNYSLQLYLLHYSESLIRNLLSTTDTLIFHMLQCANQWTRIIGGQAFRSHHLTHQTHCEFFKPLGPQ